MIINVDKKLVEYIEALEQENKQLKEQMKQAIEEISYMITNADITEISAIKLNQILGDKK